MSRGSNEEFGLVVYNITCVKKQGTLKQ